jgi:ATP-dependent DNA ligase
MHARIAAKQATLLTRNGLDWTDNYPAIASAFAALKCRRAYLDGELCAVRPDGTTTFAGLQGEGITPATPVYFAFCLLHLDAEDLIRLPLLERKAKLETLLRRPRRHRHDGFRVARAREKATAARDRQNASRGAAAEKQPRQATRAFARALGQPETRRRSHLSDLGGRRLLRHVVYQGLREDKARRTTSGA